MARYEVQMTTTLYHNQKLQIFDVECISHDDEYGCTLFSCAEISNFHANDCIAYISTFVV